MSEELYYVENVERGCVGNSLQWWKWNDNGYTCDVRAAKKFTEQEANELVRDRTKYRMRRCNYIDSIVQHHVDIQDLRVTRLNPHTLDGLIEVSEGSWKIK